MNEESVQREMAFECFLALLGNPFETEKDPEVLAKKAFDMRNAFLIEEASRKKKNGDRGSIR